MKCPNYLTVDTVVQLASSVATNRGGGGYVPARPIAFAGRWSRFRYAWLVFTGKADALIWPGGQ